jgi:hypothetical protein
MESHDGDTGDDNDEGCGIGSKYKVECAQVFLENKKIIKVIFFDSISSLQ